MALQHRTLNRRFDIPLRRSVVVGLGDVVGGGAEQLWFPSDLLTGRSLNALEQHFCAGGIKAPEIVGA